MEKFYISKRNRDKIEEIELEYLDESIFQLEELNKKYRLHKIEVPRVKEDRYDAKFRSMRMNSKNGNDLKLGLRRELMRKALLALKESKILNINSTGENTQTYEVIINNEKLQNDFEDSQELNEFLNKQCSEGSNKFPDDPPASSAHEEEKTGSKKSNEFADDPPKSLDHKIILETTESNKRSRTLSSSEDEGLPAAKKRA